MRCLTPGCRDEAFGVEVRCALHLHPSSYHDRETEAEWRERSAIESPENVELQWLRTFEASDAREFPARLRFPAQDWFHQ